MQIVVSGKHMEVSEALQTYVETKAHKACNHLVDKPTTCKVILSKDARNFEAEFVLHYKGRDFIAHAQNDTEMYPAIDQAANRLKRQLDNHHNKEKSNK